MIPICILFLLVALNQSNISLFFQLLNLFDFIFIKIVNSYFVNWILNSFHRFDSAYRDLVNEKLKTHSLVILLPQLLTRQRRRNVVVGVKADVVILAHSRASIRTAVLAGVAGQIKQV